MPSPPRVIVIVGPTGSGKSRLAVELARALGGDVINADVLQFHDSLPIVRRAFEKMKWKACDII